MEGLANDNSEDINKRNDSNFNERYPGSQYDVFDKFNDNITKRILFF